MNVLNQAGTALIPANDPPSYPLPTVPLNDAQRNAFAPRFGFAYRATKDWVVRGGYGLYYNANQLNLYTIGGNPPFSNVALYMSDPANPTLTLANPTAGAPLGASPTPNIVTFGPYLADGDGEPVESGCRASAVARGGPRCAVSGLAHDSSGPQLSQQHAPTRAPARFSRGGPIRAGA